MQIGAEPRVDIVMRAIRGGSRTCTAIAPDGHSPPADRYRLRPFDRLSK
jgi:hypothetical protein